MNQIYCRTPITNHLNNVKTKKVHGDTQVLNLANLRTFDKITKAAKPTRKFEVLEIDNAKKESKRRNPTILDDFLDTI